MLSWDINKKWLMVNQDRQAELLLASGGKLPKDSDRTPSSPVENTAGNTVLSKLSSPGSSSKKSTDVRSPPRKSASTSGRSGPQSPPAQHPRVSHTLASSSTNASLTAAAAATAAGPELNTPEYFIRKFMEAPTPALAANLEVSLRTRPIEYDPVLVSWTPESC